MGTDLPKMTYRLSEELYPVPGTNLKLPRIEFVEEPQREEPQREGIILEFWDRPWLDKIIYWPDTKTFEWGESCYTFEELQKEAEEKWRAGTSLRHQEVGDYIIAFLNEIRWRYTSN